MDAMGQTLAATSVENQIREGDAKTSGNTSSRVLTGVRSVPLKGLNTEHAGHSAQAMISRDSSSWQTSCCEFWFCVCCAFSFSHIFFPLTSSWGGIFNLIGLSPGITKPYRHKCHSLTDSPLEWVGSEGPTEHPLCCLVWRVGVEMSFQGFGTCLKCLTGLEGGGASWKPATTMINASNQICHKGRKPVNVFMI